MQSTIPEIQKWPHDTPIAELQAKLAEVYDYENRPDGKFGPTTVQNIVLTDGAGNKIRGSVWGHPDMASCKGGEFIFSGGRSGKGFKVRHGTYKDKPTVEVSLGKGGTMHEVVIGRPKEAVSKPVEAPDRVDPGKEGPPAVRSGPIALNGAMVGGVLHDAVAIVAARGGDYIQPNKVIGHIQSLAIDLIRLSNDLSSGRIQIEKPTEEQKAANLVDKKTGQPVPDEDVPY